MPMVWSAEADAKLLSKIFQICDVRVSQDQLKQIAEAMGTECTPKAVTHRISKFRNAKESSGDATPESKATKATKNGSTAKKRGKKAAGEGEDDAEESPSKKIKVKEDEADGEETGADVDEKSEGEVSA